MLHDVVRMAWQRQCYGHRAGKINRPSQQGIVHCVLHLLTVSAAYFSVPVTAEVMAPKMPPVSSERYKTRRVNQPLSLLMQACATGLEHLNAPSPEAAAAAGSAMVESQLLLLCQLCSLSSYATLS